MIFKLKKVLVVPIKNAKIVTFFLFILFSGVIHAQNQRIQLTKSDTTMLQVFKKIEKQTQLSVDYSQSKLSGVIQRKVQIQSGTLTDVLMSVLSGTGLTYKMEPGHVLIFSTTLNSAESVKKKMATGVVLDEKGDPIIGASVIEKGTSNGVITNMNGEFEIEAAGRSILQISYLGYNSAEAQAKDLLKVILKEDTQLLGEVVVVGFGTQKKVNLTGSIGTVKTDEALKSRPVTNVQELLASTVPGMVISKSSGAVGSGASINIRGTATIGGSSGVLVLIDGIPGNINTLNSNDVESISVLKDAASASIYGSRAANGVILVTTKVAKASKRPTIEFSSNIGIQNPQFTLDFVGAADYMQLYDEALMNDGKDAAFGEQGIRDLREGKYSDQKWYKEIYKSNTVLNNTYIALSGKENFTTYRFSVSNDYQDGTLPNNNYNRLIFKPDLQFQLLKNLQARVNMQYTQTNISNPNSGTTYWQSQASRISPMTPIREKNGLYAIGSPMAANPIAGVNEAGYSEERHKEMLAIFDVTYTPLANWNVKGNISTYTHDQTTKDRTKTYYLYDAEGDIAKTVNSVSSLRNSNAYSYRTQLQFITDYTFSLAEKHHFKVLGGYSQEYYKTDNFWASRDNLPFNEIDVIDTGSTNKQNGGNAKDVAIQSWFGRINYDYQGKYLFEANVRADGSSRFAKGNRWGVFPSFSGGWNMQREKFMESASWLSELKVRASWGVLGDAEKVDYYPTAQVLEYNPKIYSFANSLVGGAYNSVAINPNISWERSEQTNIGVDLGVLNQKIKLSIDYFTNKRSDILYRFPVPTEFGLSAPLTNLLKMNNRGMDFLIGYSDHKNDLSWGMDLNASFSKNKVLSMGNSDQWIEGNTITFLNDRYQLAYGYQAEGLFQSVEEIKEHAKQGSVLPGNIKFKNQNGDDVIDGKDRVVLNRKVPVNYGLNFRLGYKGIDFSMNMYGRLNTMNYMSGYEGWAFYLSQNARPMHKDAWSETNKNATYPRLTLTNTSNDTQYNSYWLRKSDFLKIQNIQVGYTLPQSVLDGIGLKSLRFYLSGQNLATITGYDGFDPEGGWYPLSRTFALGFNLQF